MRAAFLSFPIVAFALCAGTVAFADEVTVEVGHSRIEPSEVTIAAGDTVVFHNVDEMPGGHTVTAADGSFESPPLAKGEEYRHTFTEAGTVDVTIKQHPDAKGRIVVE
jgi:plastocyanin